MLACVTYAEICLGMAGADASQIPGHVALMDFVPAEHKDEEGQEKDKNQ